MNFNKKVFNVAVKADVASEDSQQAISFSAMTAALTVSKIPTVILYKGIPSNPE